MSAVMKVEDGQVRIGEYTLPGVITGLSVGAEVMIEKKDSQANSGQKKVALGYDDKTVSLSMTLYADDQFVGRESGKSAYDYLEELEAVFGTTENGAPKVYRLLTEHTRRRKIDQVIFKSLETSEGADDNAIACSLSFQEFIPAKYEIEKKAAAKVKETSASSSRSTGSGSKKPASPAVEQEPALNVVGNSRTSYEKIRAWSKR